jgi:hypothetical protein
MRVDFMGSVDFEFCFGFEFFLLFSWFYRFSCLLLAFTVFFLDDLLELFCLFGSSSCASSGLGFKIQSLCLLLSMDSSRGTLRNQLVISLVCL